MTWSIPIDNWSTGTPVNIDMMFFFIKKIDFCNLYFFFKNLAVAGDRFDEAAGTKPWLRNPERHFLYPASLINEQKWLLLFVFLFKNLAVAGDWFDEAAGT